jgi:hypothetical protein
MAGNESDPGGYRPRYSPVEGEFVPLHTGLVPTNSSGADDGYRGYTDKPSGSSDDDVEPERGPRRSYRSLTGVISLLFAAATVFLFTRGMVLAVDDQFIAARALGFVAIGISIVGFLIGGVAVITGRGRLYGAIAMVFCVIANPVLLTQVLGGAEQLLR